MADVMRDQPVGPDVMEDAFIVNYNTMGRFYLQGMPDDVSIGGDSPNWDEQGVSLRSSPIIGYSGGALREASFTITLMDSARQGDAGWHGWAVACFQWLRSLKLPDYSSDTRKGQPPLCGLFMPGTVTFEACVCKDATPTYRGDWHEGMGMVLPHMVDVSLTFAEIVITPASMNSELGSMFGNTIALRARSGILEAQRRAKVSRMRK